MKVSGYGDGGAEAKTLHPHGILPPSPNDALGIIAATGAEDLEGVNWARVTHWWLWAHGQFPKATPQCSAICWQSLLGHTRKRIAHDRLTECFSEPTNKCPTTECGSYCTRAYLTLVGNVQTSSVSLTLEPITLEILAQD